MLRAWDAWYRGVGAQPRSHVECGLRTEIQTPGAAWCSVSRWSVWVWSSHGDLWQQLSVTDKQYHLCEQVNKYFTEQLKHLQGRIQYWVSSIICCKAHCRFACFYQQCIWLSCENLKKFMLLKFSIFLPVLYLSGNLRFPASQQDTQIWTLSWRQRIQHFCVNLCNCLEVTRYLSEWNPCNLINILRYLLVSAVFFYVFVHLPAKRTQYWNWKYKLKSKMKHKAHLNFSSNNFVLIVLVKISWEPWVSLELRDETVSDDELNRIISALIYCQAAPSIVNNLEIVSQW